MTNMSETTDVLHPSIEGIAGFKAAGVHSGLRNRGKLDLAVIASEADCTAAGVFTTNQVKSAHVQYDAATLAANNTRLRAVVINSKIANVCTGDLGYQNTEKMAAIAAEELGCQPDQVLVMSTGIIGPHLPMHKVERGIRAAAQTLGANPSAWHEAAMAIMTTDTRLKIASLKKSDYHVAGIAKGSGMIAPNMATMLGMIVTDAKVAPDILQTSLKKAVDKSFNRVTVDGDTSTSDTVLLFANGMSGKAITSAADITDFEATLIAVCQSLARDIVYDGEGATKFICIQVDGAADKASARKIAHSIADSPLVKTAFAGSDANWGRIMMAAGKAGVPFDQTKANLWFDKGGDGVTDKALQVLENGQPTDYIEAYAADIFAAHDISVRLLLGEGDASETVWTCDLSKEYVAINADYRT